MFQLRHHRLSRTSEHGVVLIDSKDECKALQLGEGLGVMSPHLHAAFLFPDSPLIFSRSSLKLRHKIP